MPRRHENAAAVPGGNYDKAVKEIKTLEGG